MIHEIHITGDPSIHAAAKKLSIKTISLYLLNPSGARIKTEDMTSTQLHFSSIKECCDFVRKSVDSFTRMGVDVKRVKIEVPPQENLIMFARYVEMHTPNAIMGAPKSVNLSNLKILYTKREYDPNQYKSFIKYWQDFDKDAELELVLLDSNPNEDDIWFNMYKELD
jgi:hypothetical protein